MTKEKKSLSCFLCIGGDEIRCFSLRNVLLIRNPTLTLGLRDQLEGTVVVLIICNSESAKVWRRGRVSSEDLVPSPNLLVSKTWQQAVPYSF